MLGVQVPHRVHQRRRGQVDGAFLRSDPAELAVVGQGAPEAAQIGTDLLQGAAHHEVLQGVHRGDADLGAAPQGEGDAVAFQSCLVGVQDDVRGRVIGVGVHGVRSVQVGGGGKADVAYGEMGDGWHY